MIPRVIHIVWVGNEAMRPDNFIASWRRLNPTFEVRVWGNKEYKQYDWRLKKQTEILWKKELNGVADCMRWEILFNEGGFCVDADAEAMRPLDDFLFEASAFTCWESEIFNPGMLAAGYVAAQPGLNFFRELIDRVSSLDPDFLRNTMAWKTVGPKLLTDEYHRQRFQELTIWPSHFFIPWHHLGQGEPYTGPGAVYAYQEWGSTRRNYAGLRTAVPRGTSRAPYEGEYIPPPHRDGGPFRMQGPIPTRVQDPKTGAWILVTP